MIISRLFLSAIVFGLLTPGDTCLADNEVPIDYLTFSNGVLPVSISGDGDNLKVGYEQALNVIDGNPTPFLLTPKPGTPETRVEIVYELPAITTFSAFAIPNVGETPSPSQTFISGLEIYGSSEGPEGPFSLLADVSLKTHEEKGQTTEFTPSVAMAVQWVKLVLSGGIEIHTEKTFFEFSELAGFGIQDSVPMSDQFTGKWKGRGVLMELHQEGAMVSGCYGRTGELNGAVSGNMLRAAGVGRDDGIVSTFILNVTEDGSINGVRSTNGAPFRIYNGQPAPKGTITHCSRVAESTLGCGAIVYGIQFDFDSAEIRPESGQVLDELFLGLSQSDSASIMIEGHTSSEGTEAYNQALSERRAQSVVAALVSRGMDGNRLSAVGKGESDPIASNEDEAGRSLNRRVVIECSAEN